MDIDATEEELLGEGDAAEELLGADDDELLGADDDSIPNLFDEK